ncbi:hypothetical protein OSB04_016438 [Centaurea solstitialis]|uniref:F-box domain-containing protein n=1 Tax=Centaurea solstitialis TaxID=347529 RepID=A0AA38T8M8_9ASTR|nr:hypothetical protein OSB04_016438 [Centaurea solstitialis]
MEALPAELTMDILSRLPVKTIIRCKLVCKKWRNFVSDSFFVNLHLSRSPLVLMIQEKDKYSYFPGILKWMEIEHKVDHHDLRYDPLMSLDLNMISVFQNSLINQMGSVNGFICLWQFSPKLKFSDTYICNPVTREIMILPRQQQNYKQGFSTVAYGFGVTSLTVEYKVVRIFKSSRPSVLEADVYTLGTGQWRSLGPVPYRLYGSRGEFLNDRFHWIVYKKKDSPERICTFDLTSETFQLFPSPPSETIDESYRPSQSLAVLKGCLCKSDSYGSQFSLWVMKEYGIKKSWHKEVVITHSISHGLGRPYLKAISLTEGLKDGSILLVSMGKLWAFYPRSKTIEEIEMIDYFASVISYRPSFLRLRNFESESFNQKTLGLVYGLPNSYLQTGLVNGPARPGPNPVFGRSNPGLSPRTGNRSGTRAEPGKPGLNPKPGPETGPNPAGTRAGNRSEPGRNPSPTQPGFDQTRV